MGDPTVPDVYKQKDHSCTKGFIIVPIILIHWTVKIYYAAGFIELVTHHYSPYFLVII